jgi:hypothetical protein
MRGLKLKESLRKGEGEGGGELNIMALLTLPKEVEKDQFEKFLEKIKQDFPADRFPELVVQYQETERRGRRLIIVLGYGAEKECAEQTAKALENDPELKKNEFKLKVLREPRTKFLLR